MHYKDSVLPPLILSAGLVFLVIAAVVMNRSVVDQRALWDWEQYLANESLFVWDFSSPDDVLSVERNGLAKAVFGSEGLVLKTQTQDTYFWLNMRERMVDPKAYEFASIEYFVDKSVKFQIFVEDIEGDIFGSSYGVLSANESLKDMDLLAMSWKDISIKGVDSISWSDMKPIRAVRIDPSDQQDHSLKIKSFSLLKGFEFIDAQWFEPGEFPASPVLGQFCIFQSPTKLMVPEMYIAKSRQARVLCPNSVYFSQNINTDTLLDEAIKVESDAAIPKLERKQVIVSLLLVFVLAVLAGLLTIPLLQVLSFVVSSAALWFFAPLGMMLPCAVILTCMLAVVLAFKQERFLDEISWGFGRAPQPLVKLIVNVTIILLIVIACLPVIFDVDFIQNWREGKHYFTHYPLWVVFQQILIGPIIASLLYKSIGNDKNLILTVSSIAAILFAGLHLPNTVLVFLTLPLGFLWAYSWLRYQCIWPQMISHFVLGTAFALFSPQTIRVWGEVGPMYFSYLW